MKATLEYWNPRGECVTAKDGFTYLDNKSIISSKKELEYTNDIDLFEQFYKLNNSLRYCNGSYYKFEDKTIEVKYNSWLKSDDFKKKSFNLYYGNGVVD